jgi:putative hydrolase of the HAD superfamily
MIKAIIFDFGGVLVRTEDASGRRRWEARLGLGESELDQLVFNSEVSLRATRGELPHAAVWEHVAEALKLDNEQLDFCRQDFWLGDRLDLDLVALLKSLRPRYKTAILSNAWSSGREIIAHQFGLEQAVEAILVSAEEGLAKPDPRLYQLAAKRLGVEPGEAVMVDDFLVNVEGARAAGLHAIHYQPGLDVRAELIRLGVDTTPPTLSATSSAASGGVPAA